MKTLPSKPKTELSTPSSNGFNPKISHHHHSKGVIEPEEPTKEPEKTETETEEPETTEESKEEPIEPEEVISN